MGYHASTILTMLLNELLHSLRTRTGDGMCRGVLTATASSWVRPYDSCGDLTIVEIEPVLLPRGPGRPGAAGSCQILARSSTGRRQPTGDDEYDRTRIGAGQGRSAWVAGPAEYQ